jgi:serine/threonine protein phosphatase PrpC
MLVNGRDMQIRSDVELANASDVGCVREGNEDYFLYIEPDDDGEFAHRGRLIVVADGMGGRNGGEVASRLAAEAVRDAFRNGDQSDPRSTLVEGFHRAHQAILREAASDPELHGMGTTCCAAIVRQGNMYYGHVGDSRIYVLRDGQAEQLTEDHSMVARMVREGLLTEQQAERHEQRNVLTQALGVDSDSLAGDFPMEPLELVAGDIVLLSTDGLHGLVSGSEMALVAKDQPLGEACRELVAMAKVRGGPDNITVQMLAIRQVDR